ncbi:MAG: membrane dipeptidase [Lewinellaceae bacterium]|nr:dipeptidase [Phaeodactylibacter sp.]MCB0613741.1 dipeptidase [Phaeodactylibacter sp.]MCB9346740.1 membrane dipeptidase [Lewinellaceae bacterium]
MLMNRLIGLIILAISFSSCNRKVATLTEEAQLYEKAGQLAHQYIITDGHVDLPYRLKIQNFRLEREYIGIPVETAEGDFDYVRAKKGGLDAPFMSIFIPASYQDGRAKLLADSLINMVGSIAEAHPDKFAMATSPAEVEANFKKGLISLPMGMENGAPIEGDLRNVDYFHQRGIRYITLTHSKDNHICDSSYDTTHTWNGLSPFGREVVLEMNRVGIMVDVSHISDSAFWQVMAVTKAPCIASHSSCRKYTPGFERNMNDEMIQRLGENGGVIQINFGTDFLDGQMSKRNDAMREELDALLKKEGLKDSDADAQPIVQQFVKDHPTLYADVQTVANHIDHVVKLAGVGHVGFGSDFDGVGDSLPTGLKDVSQYPNLIYELLKRGYSEEDIEKMCYKNVWRVWKEVERVAAEM